MLFSRDLRAPDLCTSFLPPGWRIVSVQNAEDALTTLHGVSPDLFILDGDPEEMPGGQFVRLAWERMGLMPPVLFAPEAPLPSEEAAALEGVGVMKVLKHPLEGAELEMALAPFLVPPVLPAMRITELLASALKDTESRHIWFAPGGAPMGLLLGGGYIEALVHASFRDLWRARLTQAGYALPPMRGEVLDDLVFLEAELPKNDPELLALKQQALALCLQSVPPSQILKLQERRGLSRNPLLPVPIPSLLPMLVERLPEADLAPLKEPSVSVVKKQGADLTGFHLTPQEGYMLYQCEQPVRVSRLLQAGAVPEGQALKTLFLLLLLGAVETRPDAGEPVRLALLQENIEKEQRVISLQSTVIESLVASFNAPGLNPRQILGVAQNAGMETITQVHDTLHARLNPDLLHPEVRQRYVKDLLYLRAKLSEAYLMLQASAIEEKHQERAAGLTAEVEARRIGDVKTAVQKVGEAHQRECERLFRYAEELYRQEQVYECTQYLKLALFHNPGSAPCHQLMGKILATNPNARSKHQAEREFLQAVELDPWEIGYLLDLAQFYLDQGLVARCKTYLESAQKLSPKDPRVQSIRSSLRQRE